MIILKGSSNGGTNSDERGAPCHLSCFGPAGTCYWHTRVGYRRHPVRRSLSGPGVKQSKFSEPSMAAEHGPSSRNKRELGREVRF